MIRPGVLIVATAFAVGATNLYRNKQQGSANQPQSKLTKKFSLSDYLIVSYCAKVETVTPGLNPLLADTKV